MLRGCLAGMGNPGRGRTQPFVASFEFALPLLSTLQTLEDEPPLTERSHQ